MNLTVDHLVGLARAKTKYLDISHGSFMGVTAKLEKRIIGLKRNRGETCQSIYTEYRTTGKNTNPFFMSCTIEVECYKIYYVYSNHPDAYGCVFAIYKDSDLIFKDCDTPFGDVPSAVKRKKLHEIIQQ